MKRLIVVVGALIALGTAGSSAQVAAQVVPQQPVPSPARWETDRAAMLKQVMERARTHVKGVHAMVQIGTAAPGEAKTAETALADLEKLVDADSKRATRPAKTEPEIALLRQLLAEAQRDLNLARVKFNNGMIRIEEIDAAYAAVVKLLIS